MYVGKRIKQLRKHLNLTQAEFATALGVSQAYYSVIESGKKKISTKMIQTIYKKWSIGKDILDGKSLGLENDEMGGIIGGYGEGVYHRLSDKAKKKNFNKYLQLSGNKRLTYFFKFVEDLRIERPDLADMSYTFSELSAFSNDLENIYATYIDAALHPLVNSGIKNYSDYKNKSIKYLEGFLQYNDSISSIVKALKVLIEKDFPPLDAKGVLNSE